jgi:hypothetical protein
MSNRKGRTALMHVYTPIIQSSNYVYSQGDKVDVGIDKFGDEVRVGSVVISAVGGSVETYLVKEIKTAGVVALGFACLHTKNLTTRRRV